MMKRMRETALATMEIVAAEPAYFFYFLIILKK